MKFGTYLARRTGASILAVLGALCLIFLISHVLPGNPVLSRATNASSATIDQIQEQLGLDRPLGSQFVDYFSGLARGDLGDSYVTGRSVGSDLAARAPASIELALFATLLALLVSVPLGVYAAVRLLIG
jgi:peptide/nickel transport system permease protein